MEKMAFNNDKYLRIQKEEILKRVSFFGDKLYLEVGGKLFDDLHAARVLPGYSPDNKLKILQNLKSKSEVVIVINSNDIKNRKIRGDLGITYDVEVERLIIAFKKQGLHVNSVVFSFYEPNEVVDGFMRKIKNYRLPVYKHYQIAGYPQNIPLIVSEQGLGKNEYIKTTKPIIVVTAPGPGSGKMATCLSQLYHDFKHGIKSGYAKLETFPVWNLPINHPVNMAYEAATANLKDVNMIDPYHLEAYGKMAVNYNRDVETFPLLKDLFNVIMNKSAYKSPTDMGVNMVGFAIEDDEAVSKAAKDEIIRRYYNSNKDFLLGKIDEESLNKSKLLLRRLELTENDRACVKPCLDKSNALGLPVLSIELPNHKVVTGKRSDLLTATSAALLNALKELAGIDDNHLLLKRSVIVPIQELKVGPLKNANPKIHAEEILIALAIQANTNPLAKKALDQLGKLKNCEAHSSCLLAASDLKTLNKLEIRVTEEPNSYFYRV